MTFQLDTSGEVGLTIAQGIPAEIAGGHCWSDLSPFTQGYIEALWCAVVELRRDAEDRIQMNLDDLGFRHLAPETLERIIADCEARSSNMAAIFRDVEAGRKFWRDRQIDPDPGYFPPLTVQLGDDGKVRFA